jgi:hypothetical protein
MSQFTNGLKIMQDRAAQALRGDRAGVKAFEDLGIGLSELTGLMGNPIGMMNRMSDAMVQLQGTGKLTQAAMESIGRSGTDLLPFLLKGSQGMADMAEKHKAFGAGVSADAAELGAMWQSMETSFSSLWQGIETKLATPVLGYLSDHFEEITGAIEKFAYALQDGVGKAMENFVPWIETAWGFVSGLGDTIGGVIVPLLEIVAPILEDIAKLVKFIMDASAVSLNGLAAGLHALVGDTSGADAASNRAIDAMNRTGEDLGWGSGAPSGDIHIGKVEMKVDPHWSSGQLGEPIKQAIQKASREFDDAAAARHAQLHVAHAIGARSPGVRRMH